LLTKKTPPSFDPNAPRGGAERGGGYLSILELLLREEREKEKKLGGGGKGSSAEKDEQLDSKVLLKELLKVSNTVSFFPRTGLELTLSSPFCSTATLTPSWSCATNRLCARLNIYTRCSKSPRQG
jgi:hypothetical protein